MKIEGIESKLNLADIDIALSIFSEHFPASQNITFEFSLKSETSVKPDFGLLDIIYVLEKQGWHCKYNKHELNYKVPGKYNLQSGFVYGKKDSVDYGAAGFVYFNKKENLVVDGVLYGHDKKDLEKTYRQMLEIFRQKFGDVKKLEPTKKFAWQI